MGKAISIIIMVLVVLGIVGFLFINASEYYCDEAEVEENGVQYKAESCCRYFGFSCYEKKTPIEQ